MTDSPELSAPRPPRDSAVDNVDSDALPVESSAAPHRRPRRGALSPLLSSAALRVQQSLVPVDFVSKNLLPLQKKIAYDASWAARTQLISVMGISTAWESAAAKAAADIARASTGWETSAAKAIVDSVWISSGVEAAVGNAIADMADLTAWENCAASKMANLAASWKHSAAAQAVTKMATFAVSQHCAAKALTDHFAQMSSMWVESTRMSTGLAQQLSGASLLKPQVAQALGAVASLGAWVQDSLAGWQEAGLRVVRVAVVFSERMYFAVLAAQDAAMRGDLKEVERFFKQWTELPRTGWNARMHAGADVLLTVDLTEFGPETAFELVELIETETNRHFRRGRRMLGDTDLNYLRVVSLEQLPVLVGPEVAPGMLPKAPSAEARVLAALNEFDDTSLDVVIGGLTPEEAQIACARGFTTSWREAALLCGHSSSEAKRLAERVRDKVVGRMRRMNTQTQRSTSPFGLRPR